MRDRQIAFECLCKIINEKQYSNIVMRNAETTPLVTQLVYGTLRNYRLVRQAYSKYLEKRVNNRVYILLDMACYELLLLDKPAYATINECVEIAKTFKGAIYAPTVNAILHKVKKSDLNTDNLAVMTSHPDWMVNLWTAHYGKEIAEKICREDIAAAKVALRVNTMVTSKQKLLEDPNFYSGTIENCLYYKGNVLESSAYKENKVVIQSESSQAAIQCLQLKEGFKVLDICAAPGSKSLQIAMAMNDKGEVYSNDIYDFRVKLIEKNAKRYGLTSIKTSCVDGLKISETIPKEGFDVVLLDAPCSGLGTIKHKPEIKQNITDKDLDDIVNLQKGLFAQAGLMVKKGGTLLYSTCTLNKKENEKQVENFIKNNEDFTIELSQTIFPFEYHSDGFYYCKLHKK